MQHSRLTLACVFAAAAMRAAPVPPDGRPGKREQCVEAAQEALDRGESVLIDRTNVTPVSGRGPRHHDMSQPAFCIRL